MRFKSHGLKNFVLVVASLFAIFTVSSLMTSCGSSGGGASADQTDGGNSGSGSNPGDSEIDVDPVLVASQKDKRRLYSAFQAYNSSDPMPICGRGSDSISQCWNYADWGQEENKAVNKILKNVGPVENLITTASDYGYVCTQKAGENYHCDHDSPTFSSPFKSKSLTSVGMFLGVDLCGVDIEGRFRCWGRNPHIHLDVPTEISDLTWKKVVAGAEGVTALSEDGRLFFWDDKKHYDYADRHEHLKKLKGIKDLIGSNHYSYDYGQFCVIQDNGQLQCLHEIVDSEPLVDILAVRFFSEVMCVSRKNRPWKCFKERDVKVETSLPHYWKTEYVSYDLFKAYKIPDDQVNRVVDLLHYPDHPTNIYRDDHLLCYVDLYDGLKCLSNIEVGYQGIMDNIPADLKGFSKSPGGSPGTGPALVSLGSDGQPLKVEYHFGSSSTRSFDLQVFFKNDSKIEGLKFRLIDGKNKTPLTDWAALGKLPKNGLIAQVNSTDAVTVDKLVHGLTVLTVEITDDSSVQSIPLGSFCQSNPEYYFNFGKQQQGCTEPAK